MISKLLFDLMNIIIVSSAELYQIEIAFKQHATDGVVSRIEFEAVMESLGLSHMPLDRMYSLFDTDENSQVDYKEFLLGLGTLRGDDQDASLQCTLYKKKYLILIT